MNNIGTSYGQTDNSIEINSCEKLRLNLNSTVTSNGKTDNSIDKKKLPGGKLRLHL